MGRGTDYFLSCRQFAVCKCVKIYFFGYGLGRMIDSHHVPMLAMLMTCHCSLHVLFRSILLWFPIAAAGRRWFCAVFRTWSRKRRVSCVASSIPWLRAACMAASSRASRVLRQTVLSDETWGVKAAVWTLFRRTSLADSSVVSIGRSKRTWEGACSGPHFEQRS